MDESRTLDVYADRPALPVPTRPRWQPLRLGLVELFRYDSEEFWFRDGHLLLRGNNGTGKSKVLSLTLPFLLDAQLRPSRIEPDGDPGKKMSWNLLLGSYDRRTGYAWIEFGRLGEDGVAHYLTLGAGLSAVAARSEVESWFFILEDGGARLGRDLWLTTEQRNVLTREKLRETLLGRGQIFDTASAYRRAVDERLLHLGQKRYEALMDTLVQLRQPQLSRRPDEAALSNALTEALPPMPADLLSDVAEALNQLEEDRRTLEEFQQLGKAVRQFEHRYRLYAGTLARRQMRELRQAQTEFDNASRERNEALTRLEQARSAEDAAEAGYRAADLALSAARTRLETLQSDPTMQDANRLDGAERDVQARRRSVEEAESSVEQAAARLSREETATAASAETWRQAEEGLADARREAVKLAEAAGVAAGLTDSPLLSSDAQTLSDLAGRELAAAQQALRSLVPRRREELQVIGRRLDACAEAAAALHRRQDEGRERAEVLAEATARRAACDSEVLREGDRLVDAWTSHAAALRELRLDAEAVLPRLADWAAAQDGENPALRALQAAQQEASLRLAGQQHEIDREAAALEAERDVLEAEHRALDAGRDTAPPLPYTRRVDSRVGRAGAPFWQLVDFADPVDAVARAGLEAALEASGLLDAWVTPDGAVIGGEDGTLWQDQQWVARPAVAASLAGWLRPAIPEDSAVHPDIVARLLAAIACSEDDVPAAEAWVSPTGRYRLGALAGAWAKADAVHIGFAARAAARERRRGEIALQLDDLAAQRETLGVRAAALSAARRRAEAEWRDAPSDQALAKAHLAAAAAARERQAAADRLTQAEASCRSAEQAVAVARAALERDAADLRLPADRAGLAAIDAVLNALAETVFGLLQAVRDIGRAWPDLLRQHDREAEARDTHALGDARLAAARREFEESRARFEVLRMAVGAKVEELRRQLADARGAATGADEKLRAAADRLRADGENRAVAHTVAANAEAVLAERLEVRAAAVHRLQRFAATDLLVSAVPDIELPDRGVAWTIDPALTLARRTEQALQHVKDDDESWARVQRLMTEDLQDLQRALTVLGHQAPAETSDWGLVVHIVYQNKPERPDVLADRLADEIAQRSELLTAQERTILENHLQAEIASEIQRLLRAAEKRLEAINAELHKRPTSTGVRYRLQWEPLPDGEGAPVGLAAARRNLLNTGSDLWSAEDRRVVGAMLQDRIAAERAAADTGGESGGLIDQLARALDYRRWHRFRVQRFQDQQWRKLSGPASSGERALGLTVPLFAAIASFYSQGSFAHAPRLMLLDEAFAGIDDAARAHCMALIREFDLDFVMTSEREWGCYAELPGVAICHLQRREGIDAVYVSRWSWDGRARRQDSDPDRRFAPE